MSTPIFDRRITEENTHIIIAIIIFMWHINDVLSINKINTLGAHGYETVVHKTVLHKGLFHIHEQPITGAYYRSITLVHSFKIVAHDWSIRYHFVYAPRLWEVMLHCNVVSHRSGTYISKMILEVLFLNDCLTSITAWVFQTVTLHFCQVNSSSL